MAKQGTSTAIKPVDQVKAILEKGRGQIEAALPSHIDADKFIRVAVTACNEKPELLEADRNSLYQACMKCAADGLIPDGREAALVNFWSTKENINKVQYMPMVAGILKKVRNSGELGSFGCMTVYQGEEWEYYVDENGEHFKHTPDFEIDRDHPNDRAGENVRFYYAFATLKNGSSYLQVLTKSQIEKARSVNKKSEKGPWITWYEEMAHKTCAKKISKRLPMSSDLEDFMRVDDALTDLDIVPTDATGGEAEAPVGHDVPRTSRMEDIVDRDADVTTAPAAPSAGNGGGEDII